MYVGFFGGLLVVFLFFISPSPLTPLIHIAGTENSYGSCSIPLPSLSFPLFIPPFIHFLTYRHKKPLSAGQPQTQRLSCPVHHMVAPIHSNYNYTQTSVCCCKTGLVDCLGERGRDMEGEFHKGCVILPFFPCIHTWDI